MLLKRCISQKNGGTNVDRLKNLLLKHVDNFLNNLASFSDAVIILFDSSGKIIDYTRSLERLIGTEESLAGRNLREFVVDNAVEKLVVTEDSKVKIGLADNTSVIHLVTGFVMKIDDEYRILFGEKIGLTAGNMLESMSKITDELVDLSRELSKKNRELQRANTEIERLMNCDPLTGLANRREFMRKLDEAISDYSSRGIPLSIIMADIDNFKKINDSKGHPEGDKVLKLFSEILQSVTSPRRTVVRYGGEEFIVMLPDLAGAEAAQIAEDIRETLECASRKALGFSVTASFGVTSFESGDTKSTLLKRVDDALYSAKKGGKNLVKTV
jgi:diguanylate cyclase (GGDEF)-like protein